MKGENVFGENKKLTTKRKIAAAVAQEAPWGWTRPTPTIPNEQNH